MEKKIKLFIVKHFLSYDQKALEATLRQFGVVSKDRIMLHSSWLSLNGFQGRPIEMINVLKEIISPEGLLVVPTLTYQNQSSREFLLSGKPMNVRRSASQMGLLSEVFRRGKDVHRSLSPTHPLAAWGNDSVTFLAGHENCLVPFGIGSPFEKLLQLDGKILTIDAPFSTITFTHFLEDRIAEFLPFSLYEEKTMSGTVIDYEGREHKIAVKVLSEQANAMRQEQRLIDELDRQGVIRQKKIGNTRLMLIDCKAMTDCVDEMARSGRLFFDTPGD
jgi:aminoglycoside 3-N-acetyltransferase